MSKLWDPTKYNKDTINPEKWDKDFKDFVETFHGAVGYMPYRDRKRDETSIKDPKERLAISLKRIGSTSENKTKGDKQ